MGFLHKSSYNRLSYSHSLNNHPDRNAFERHCHEHYELLYVVKGKGHYVVESAEYPLQPNTLLFIRPYEFHYVCPQEDYAYERYVFSFQDTVLPKTVAALPMMQTDGVQGHGVYFSESCLDEAVRDTLEHLDDSCARFANTPNHLEKEETFVLAELTRVLLMLSLSEPKTSSAGEENVIAQVIEYLNLHLESKLSLDFLAQHFFISKSYLCHAFRKYTGVSVFTYLNTKRITMAQRLLKDGEPATAVAYQVGFYDYSSFYRTFYKLTGHAPVYNREEKESEKSEKMS